MNWIDPFEPHWLDELDRRTQHPSNGLGVRLVLDAVFAPGLAEQLQQIGCAPELVFRRLPCANRPAALTVSPLVLTYCSGHAALKTLLQTTCSTRPMVTAVHTRESPEELADRLAQWSIVDAAGTLLHLRWGDTRRLPKLAQVLQPQQRTALIGLAQAWWCIGRDGHWQTLPLGEGGPLPAASASPPTLTPQQVAALIDDSEPDEMLAMLERELEDVWRTTRASWRHAQASKALQEAQRCAVQELGQRLARVRQALQSAAHWMPQESR
jgi:hypothetical protein